MQVKKQGGYLKKVDGLTSKLIPQLKELSEADKDSIFYNGIDNIQEALDSIRRDKPDFRVVIFVDDYNRCSPSKTVEVLESMKVFLSLNGIIYILGLSNDIVTKLIEVKYKETGVKGEQYIKKMIQIPIILPQWDNRDISKLVIDFIKKGIIHDKYQPTVEKNIDLISAPIENNPREIKRFINNYIVACEIHSEKIASKEIDATHLLIIQVINVRWNKFYQLMVRFTKEFRKEFLGEIKKYTELQSNNRISQLESDKIEEGFSSEIKMILHEFRSEDELWKFLKSHCDAILQITDWEIYRHACRIGGAYNIHCSEVSPLSN